MSSARHPSDSTPQRESEVALVCGLSSQLGVPLTPERFDLGDCTFEVDGTHRDDNAKRIVLAEAHTRIKKYTAAHKEKIASDVLKMLLLGERLQEQVPGYTLEMYLIVTNQKFHQQVTDGSTWLAQAIKEFGIQVHYHQLTEDEITRLEAATANQAEGMRG